MARTRTPGVLPDEARLGRGPHAIRTHEIRAGHHLWENPLIPGARCLICTATDSPRQTRRWMWKPPQVLSQKCAEKRTIGSGSAKTRTKNHRVLSGLPVVEAPDQPGAPPCRAELDAPLGRRAFHVDKAGAREVIGDGEDAAYGAECQALSCYAAPHPGGSSPNPTKTASRKAAKGAK